LFSWFKSFGRGAKERAHGDEPIGDTMGQRSEPQLHNLKLHFAIYCERLSSAGDLQVLSRQRLEW
jgi:hypothetical protein